MRQLKVSNTSTGQASHTETSKESVPLDFVTGSYF